MFPTVYFCHIVLVLSVIHHVFPSILESPAAKLILNHNTNLSGIYHRPHWIKDDYEFRSHVEEILFFFADHDNDKNSMLDGLELMKAISHIDYPFVDQIIGTGRERIRSEIELKTKWMAGMVDLFLEKADYNNDGYFNWPEFRAAALEFKIHRFADDEDDDD